MVGNVTSNDNVFTRARTSPFGTTCVNPKRRKKVLYRSLTITNVIFNNYVHLINVKKYVRSKTLITMKVQYFEQRYFCSINLQNGLYNHLGLHQHTYIHYIGTILA